MATELTAKRYRVTGKYITVKTMTPDGVQVRGLHEGAPLPLDVEQAAIDHHLAVGLIEEIPAAAPPTPEEEAAAAAQRVIAAEAAAKAAEEELTAAQKARARADAAVRKTSGDGEAPARPASSRAAAGSAKG